MNKPDQTINDYIQMIDNLEKKLEIAEKKARANEAARDNVAELLSAETKRLNTAIEALEFVASETISSCSMCHLHGVCKDITTIESCHERVARQALKEIRGEK